MISVKENSLNKHPLSFPYCCPDCTAVYALLSNTVAFIMSSFLYTYVATVIMFFNT